MAQENLGALIYNRINCVPGNTYQDKLNFLSTCNCCHRHCMNKPMVFTCWKETTSEYDGPRDCNCDCRHVARFICRQYENPDVVIINTPSSTASP